jgi:3-oxoacyl-[acyl-carrier-protein] synthase II
VLNRVVVTGVGVVDAGLVGGADALDRVLAARSAVIGATRGPSQALAESPPLVDDDALRALIDATEARRLSRACRLAVAAGRMALRDAGVESGDAVGIVIGTEFGDLRSTIEFVDGYLRSGTGGLSALLFPNTVMNAMTAATAIAVRARELSLTLNAPTVAGELAVAQASLAVGGGRVDAVLAGGVDQVDDGLRELLARGGARVERGSEGATLLVLESFERAHARGARILGEILGVAWRALPARRYGVGTHDEPRAVTAALTAAGESASALGWISVARPIDDDALDAWETRLIAAVFGTDPPPSTSLGGLFARHAGTGALRVAAAMSIARSGRLPASGTAARGNLGLVHGIARGGTEVALVVGPAPAR